MDANHTPMKKTFNIIVYIFGFAVFAASAVFLLITLLSMDKRPVPVTAYERAQAKFENHYFITADDMKMALVIGGIVAAVWVIINILLFFTKGMDSAYYNEVNKAIQNPFIRFFGTAILFGVTGGAIYLIMENVTATAEYPAKCNELPEFMGGFAVLGLLVYYFLRFVLWLFSKKNNATENISSK